ncbi:MAG: DUF1566 domain-containing protein [Cryomorphaceae bacterium]|nr:DUF1566 domain-containing protein [Cryomorphaceae bacterium]
MKAPKLLFVITIITLSFSACKSDDDQSVEPEITINTPDLIIHNAIRISGNIKGQNIQSSGLVLNTIPRPTRDHREIELDKTSGNFTLEIDELERNTTYYIRGFLIVEDEIIYGNEIGFTTSSFFAINYSENVGDTVVLFVAPTDNAQLVPWGPDTLTGADNPSDGRINTQLLAGLSGNFLAKTCSQSTAGGYNDWYLPSVEELEAIYQNRSEIGNLANIIYWSSTEYSEIRAKGVNMLNGQIATPTKSAQYYCRCVRRP